MNPKYFFCSEYCVGFILLQVKISTSEKWTVITSTGHLVATVGGQTELSCQLSPSQSAENLEVQWSKGKNSKLVHLFKGGREVNEDIAREYVNRTEFVQTAIGKGKLTLKLHNISVSDDGTYQCSFKGENFSDVASINLSVAALGLKTQVRLQDSGFKGFVVECKSGGWFPEPQMEWRNSKGEVIPHSSKSYSQDEAKLFHMEMTLFLSAQQRSNITCCIFNSLLGKGRHTNITLTDEMFISDLWMHVLILAMSVMIICIILFTIYLCVSRKVAPRDWFCTFISVGSESFGIVFICLKFFNKVIPSDWISIDTSVTCQLICFSFLGIVPDIYLKLRNRVSISDPIYFEYNNWIWEIAILILVVAISYSILLIILYCTLKDSKLTHQDISLITQDHATGTMEIVKLSFIIYFYSLILLHLITSTSGQFTVTALQEYVFASLQGEAELSCQLFPPQSAEHMEIRWFRNRYTEPVHLYKNGKDIYGETVSKYVERTEFLKEDIGEGKVTLRILNVSVDDDGLYHCLFQDGEFYDEAITELKVTATSSEVQILLHPPNLNGVLVECNSEGWFPQPHMEWTDDRGISIPPTSQSHSQNKDKLFNMKMSLLLSSLRNVTCNLRNPLTGQEEMTSLVLPDTLFPWNIYSILMLSEIGFFLLIFSLYPSVELQKKLKGKYTTCTLKRKRTETWSLRYNSCKDCCLCNLLSPLGMGVLILFVSSFVSVILIVRLHHRNRVPASDPHYELDRIWLQDITVVLITLVIFITMIISFLYFKIRDILQV